MSRDQIIERLKIVSSYTTWIKTCTDHGLENISLAAHEMELKTAVCAWLGTDNASNDGTIDSIEANPVYVFKDPGSYTINLTVTNEKGTASKTLKIVAQETQYTDSVLPFADFSANVTSGYAPLSVLFTDLSQKATSRSWDIDNNGQVDSTDTSFVYVYTNAGTYTVNLTAGNENGTTSKTITIDVQTENSGGSSGSSGGSSGSSGGSSGGGGGGGGSPELQSNVEAKELSQAFVTNGNKARFEFPRNATCVVHVSFDAKKTFGKTTTIAELLKEKSSMVPELPAGEIYKSFNYGSETEELRPPRTSKTLR